TSRATSSARPTATARRPSRRRRPPHPRRSRPTRYPPRADRRRRRHIGSASLRSRPMVASVPPTPRARARDLGIAIGALPTGATNGIVDVPGVRVGHTTVWHDEPAVARTGVTAILPDTIESVFDAPMTAGTAVLNGAGELTSSVAVAEWGVLETPI